MTGKPDHQEKSVHVDIAARAEAKLEVKATVPASSMGRFVDAVTDLFRPYSEAQGLRADLIRLQREEVAIKIAKLARLKADSQSARLTAPPLKVLIPLFEKASQEDTEDQFMVNLWADLLLSASTEVSIPPRFVSILGEMNGNQARLFMEIANKGIESDEITNLVIEDTVYKLEQLHIEKKLDNLLRQKDLTVQNLYVDLLPILDVPGGAVVDIIVNAIHGLSTAENKYVTAQCQSDLEILASLGLMRYVYIDREKRRGEIERMGSDFFDAVSPERQA